MNRLLLAAALSAVAFGLEADTVELKSGSILKGQAGLIQEGKLAFKTEDLGDLKIDIAKIVKIDVEKDHVVQHPDNTKETLKLGIADGKLVKDGKPLDMSTVKATDPAVETWHGNVALGYTGKRGNTYEDSASVRADVNRRFEKDRLTGHVGYDYGKTGTATTDNKKSTDKWDAEIKHDHFWLPKVYHYEDILWERDVIKDLNARYTVGLGGGYQWLDKSKFDLTGVWNFNQELGVNWIKEEWENNDDQKDGGFCALRYSHHLGFIPVWAGNLEFFHNFRILPEVDEWEKFLAKADIGVQAKLVYNFMLDLRVEWDYDSKPADDMKKDDLRYIVGLGYKW